MYEYYTGDDIKRIAVASKPIDDMLKNRERQGFALAIDFANDELRAISPSAADALINAAKRYRLTGNYEAMVQAFEDNTGKVFKIMVATIQARNPR